jgi:hypothetical protein
MDKINHEMLKLRDTTLNIYNTAIESKNFIIDLKDSEIKKLEEENQKLKAERDEYKKALEFYGNPDSWVDDNVTYVYSVIQYDDQEIPEKHELCDKHGGRRAREALKKWEE